MALGVSLNNNDLTVNLGDKKSNTYNLASLAEGIQKMATSATVTLPPNLTDILRELNSKGQLGTLVDLLTNHGKDDSTFVSQNKIQDFFNQAFKGITPSDDKTQAAQKLATNLTTLNSPGTGVTGGKADPSLPTATPTAGGGVDLDTMMKGLIHFVPIAAPKPLQTPPPSPAEFPGKGVEITDIAFVTQDKISESASKSIQAELFNSGFLDTANRLVKPITRETLSEAIAQDKKLPEENQQLTNTSTHLDDVLAKMEQLVKGRPAAPAESLPKPLPQEAPPAAPSEGHGTLNPATLTADQIKTQIKTHSAAGIGQLQQLIYQTLPEADANAFKAANTSSALHPNDFDCSLGAGTRQQALALIQKVGDPAAKLELLARVNDMIDMYNGFTRTPTPEKPFVKTEKITPAEVGVKKEDLDNAKLTWVAPPAPRKLSAEERVTLSKPSGELEGIAKKDLAQITEADINSVKSVQDLQKLIYSTLDAADRKTFFEHNFSHKDAGKFDGVYGSSTDKAARDLMDKITDTKIRDKLYDMLYKFEQRYLPIDQLVLGQ